jgi:hypothetical protein
MTPKPFGKASPWLGMDDQRDVHWIVV